MIKDVVSQLEMYLGGIDFRNPRIVLNTSSIPKHALLVDYADEQLADLQPFRSDNYDFPGLRDVPIVHYNIESGNNSSFRARNPILPSQVKLASSGIRWKNYYNNHCEMLLDMIEEPRKRIVKENSLPASIDHSVEWFNPTKALRLGIRIGYDGRADFNYKLFSGDGEISIPYLSFWTDFTNAGWAPNFVSFIESDETGLYQKASLDLFEERLLKARVAASKVSDDNFKERFKESVFFKVPYSHDLGVLRNIARRLNPQRQVDESEFRDIYDAVWDLRLNDRIREILGRMAGNLSDMIENVSTHESNPISRTHVEALELILGRVSDGRIKMEEGEIRKKLGEVVVLYGQYLDSRADSSALNLEAERSELEEDLREYSEAIQRFNVRLDEINSRELQEARDEAIFIKQESIKEVRDRLSLLFGEDKKTIEDLIRNTEPAAIEDVYDDEIPF
jgi:hypothetical protein